MAKPSLGSMFMVFLLIVIARSITPTIASSVQLAKRGRTTVNLYGHAETGTIDGSPDLLLLKTAIPDGSNLTLTLETASADCLSMGNFSMFALSDLCNDPQTMYLTTVECRYRAKANVTNLATMCLYAMVINVSDWEDPIAWVTPTGCCQDPPNQYCCCCSTTKLTTSWATHVGSCIMTSEIDLTQWNLDELYLVVGWMVDKDDITAMKIELLFDEPSLATDEHTGLYNIQLNCIVVSGVIASLLDLIPLLYVVLIMSIAMVAIYSVIPKKR